MQRRSLGVIAIVIVILMVIVATAGLDHLPRSLQQSIAAANGKFNDSRTALIRDRDAAERAFRDDPQLFQNQAAAWRSRLDQDQQALQKAAAELTTLQQLEKANRRTDADKVKADLAEFDALRTAPVRDADEVASEVQKWIGYKRDLPHRIDTMKADYDEIESVDLDSASPVKKAEVDWPAKKNDLETRLDALKNEQAEARRIWDSTAEQREGVAKHNLTNFDYAGLFTKAEQLDRMAADVKNRVQSLDTLAEQLYTAWDKQLVEADKRDGREKVRIVTTRFPDATLTHGRVSTDEHWEPLLAGGYRQATRELGMVIEHKPAGKYDSEAEHVVEPPAYAYIAPPGQSNPYGYWSGSVWHWLPEYLILSHLLRSTGPVITTGDWDAYQAARRRGEIFYGRNNEYRNGDWARYIPFPRSRPDVSAPSNSSAGGWYQERPKPSFGDHSFGGSKYQSRGTYGGSRFQSRGGFGGFSRGAARSFGHGGRR